MTSRNVLNYDHQIFADLHAEVRVNDQKYSNSKYKRAYQSGLVHNMNQTIKLQLEAQRFAVA